MAMKRISDNIGDQKSPIWKGPQNHFMFSCIETIKKEIFFSYSLGDKTTFEKQPLAFSTTSL